MIKATKISSILSTKNVHTRLYRKGRDPLNEFYGDNLIFVHTRTSGLNEQKDLLLEIACAITTKDLQLLSEVYSKSANPNLIERKFSYWIY